MPFLKQQIAPKSWVYAGENGHVAYLQIFIALSTFFKYGSIDAVKPNASNEICGTETRDYCLPVLPVR